MEFDSLRGAPELEAERKQLSSYLAAEPDKTLALIAEMDLGGPEVEQGAVFACPMHPAIVASWAGKCPKCGMKLVAAEPGVEPPTAYVCPMHPEVTATWAATCPKCGMTLRPSDAGGDGEHGHETSHEEAGGHGHGAGHSHGTAEGIEWEDDMVDVNRVTTPANMRWG